MKTRYIPKDYANVIKREDINAVVHYGQYRLGAGKWSAIAYSGKRTKYDFHYSSKTKDQMEKHIDEYFNNLAETIKWKAELKAERKIKAEQAISTYNVGDILVCLWGYDQTNVDFYEIVEKKNKTIVIEEIGQIYVKDSGGFMSEQVIADPKIRTGKFKTKRIGAYGISLNSYSSAYKWDGEEKYQSHYA